MKTNQAAGRQGFTIVEMLLYMGLLTMLVTMLTSIFIATTNVQLESQAVGPVEEDSRFIFSRFGFDMGQAQSIVTPASPGEEGDTLTLLVDGIATTYSISGTNLVLANANGVNALNSVGSRISNLSFQRLGSSSNTESIQMKFTINSTTERIQGVDEKEVETTVALR